MKAKQNIIPGSIYSKLTVLSDAGIIKGNRQWNCQCECGKFTAVRGTNLKSGLTKSCGCIRGRPPEHGGFGTQEYQCWTDMKRRCYNKKSPAYVGYGARGIAVCKEWDDSFLSFLEYVGPCPQGMSLDRINNDGDYEPGNVRWASVKEQARNRRSSKWIEYKGESKLLITWCEELGLEYRLMIDRLGRQKWPPAKAFETPLQEQFSNKSTV